MINKKLKVAVLFGGRSPEHEVSIISGIQVLNALDKDKFEVVPVYISKSGKWLRGDASFYDPKTFKNLDHIANKYKSVIMSTDPNLDGFINEPKGISLAKNFTAEQVDVFFPVFHGRYGEDGAIQGAFELAGIPYTGCDIQASAIGMDKVVSKRIAQSLHIPVMKDIWINIVNWKENRKDILKSFGLTFPVFVKPARLGSSIGINKAHNMAELEEFLDVAFFYESKVMIEESLENAKEVNISIIGNDPYELSICEMPVSRGEVLSFSDKYTSSNGQSKGMASAKRLIPAPIKKETKEKIEKYSNAFFAEIGGQGIARIDFLVSNSEKEIYFNEINTMPGSLAFYLWKEVGMSFDKLVEKLVNFGIERHAQKASLITSFKSNILEGFNGAKVTKS